MSRDDLIKDFLDRAGWGSARREPLKGDASTRRYERIHGAKLSAILMDQPAGKEAAACPPDATPEARRALGYNALARLAGPDVRPFAAIGAELRARGLSAPEIYAADYANGLLLLEDLGDDLYARAVEAGANPEPLYAQAIDVLAELHRTHAPSHLATSDGWRTHFLSYDEEALLVETDLMLDWFFPAALGHDASRDLRVEYHALWREALRPALTTRRVMVLRDYHAENLLWMPARRGNARVGLIDFQDGLHGSDAYDLMSLVEDARRDVDPVLAEKMIERYIAAARSHDAGFDTDEFRAAAAVLAAQRNIKIVGIFTRLWKRDGKSRYPGYHPRLWRYLDRDLAHPNLTRLKGWFDRYVPKEKRNILATVAK
jgi:N-acetylmuramate 1-kinase